MIAVNIVWCCKTTELVQKYWGQSIQILKHCKDIEIWVRIKVQAQSAWTLILNSNFNVFAVIYNLGYQGWECFIAKVKYHLNLGHNLATTCMTDIHSSLLCIIPLRMISTLYFYIVSSPLRPGWKSRIEQRRPHYALQSIAFFFEDMILCKAMTVGTRTWLCWFDNSTSAMTPLAKLFGPSNGVSRFMKWEVSSRWPSPMMTKCFLCRLHTNSA